MSEELSDEQRARVIRDLLCHQAESAEAGKEVFEKEEIQEWALWLKDEPPDELRSIWEGSVGEWLASRGDVGPADDPETDFDEWVDEQYQRLLNGIETDYGFVRKVEIDVPILEEFAEGDDA
ncbi:hypothetical protein HLRTI_000442 [Halorhabdus tiamatea SARL4B]|uniref:Uncharacterized protein n=1 Tax=Halorhabdus tiamatea SARL4B TaxID=1033806 RepID=F7PMK0_9EURY|nr:hypothetical protein [Halorhabdus tiamatea]ERJ07400.1 hypothetical protein HLRTI_000442 [Halorhabdus tiamatea SARL4B]